MLNLLSDELGPFAVLGTNRLESFDEFIARSDSVRDDCAERDWDHVGENSKCNIVGCLIPTGIVKYFSGEGNLGADRQRNFQMILDSERGANAIFIDLDESGLCSLLIFPAMAMKSPAGDLMGRGR